MYNLEGFSGDVNEEDGKEREAERRAAFCWARSFQNYLVKPITRSVGPMLPAS